MHSIMVVKVIILYLHHLLIPLIQVTIKTLLPLLFQKLIVKAIKTEMEIEIGEETETGTGIGTETETETETETGRETETETEIG